MNGNSVTLVGNTTREPELRYTAGGQAQLTFGLAVNRRWQNKTTQEWEEHVSFVNVVCWADMAENVATSCPKGTRVVVSGRLEQRTWEKDGEKRSAVEVVADEIGVSLRFATAEVARTERTERAPAAPAPVSAYGEEPFRFDAHVDVVPLPLRRLVRGSGWGG